MERYRRSARGDPAGGAEAVRAGQGQQQDFSRFTPRAQKVVTASLTDAQTRKIAIEPANLAVALFTQPDGIAAKALEAQG